MVTTAAVGVRQTLPNDTNWFQRGFKGIIPRRGMGSNPLLDAKTSLLRYAQDTPLRMMSILPDIHPMVGLATWNALRLACCADDLQIVAVPVDQPDDSDDTDENGTTILNDLWSSLPNEIGGLQGLQTTLTMQAMFTGLVCCEAVPGVSGQGVTRVWPVDSLSIYFGRDDARADITPYQRQIGGAWGYQELDPQRFFWRSVDAWVDDPYGRAPYATALAEVLRDLAIIQDLTDAIHHAAWPRLALGFSFDNAYRIAVEVLMIRDPKEAADWVMEEFNRAVDAQGKIKADDTILFDGTTAATIIEGGKGLGNLAEILTFLRQRVLMSLKSLPTLMGINDGSTQTYTTVEWRIYAEGLETMRGMVAELLTKAADLHLRLLGLPLKAKAVLNRIRTSDEQMDAATEATKIANAVEKRDQGWIDQDQASNEITGSDAVGPAPAPIMPEPTPGTRPPQLQDVPPAARQEQSAGAKAEIARRWQARRLEYERLASGRKAA